MKIYSVLVWMLAVSLTLGGVDLAFAKEKGGNLSDKKVRLDGEPGKGQKAVPPGKIMSTQGVPSFPATWITRTLETLPDKRA